MTQKINLFRDGSQTRSQRMRTIKTNTKTLKQNVKEQTLRSREGKTPTAKQENSINNKKKNKQTTNISLTLTKRIKLNQFELNENRKQRNEKLRVY